MESLLQPLTRIMSIDIGMKNFSFGIEERDCFNDPLGHPELNGNMVVLENLEMKSQQAVVELLDSYHEIIKTCCGGIVIESQVRSNQICVKMQQHLVTYFMIVHPLLKVHLFQARHKLRIFPPEEPDRVKTYRQRKQYSVTKSLELLQKRGELAIIDKLNAQPKKDDMADVFLQLQAFKIMQQ